MDHDGPHPLDEEADSPFSIRASSSRIDVGSRILKADDTFVVLDEEATQPIFEALVTDAPPVQDPAHLPTSIAVELRGNVDATLFIGDLYATEGVGEVATVDGMACQILDGSVGVGYVGDAP